MEGIGSVPDHCPVGFGSMSFPDQADSFYPLAKRGAWGEILRITFGTIGLLYYAYTQTNK